MPVGLGRGGWPAAVTISGLSPQVAPTAPAMAKRVHLDVTELQPLINIPTVHARRAMMDQLLGTPGRRATGRMLPVTLAAAQRYRLAHRRPVPPISVPQYSNLYTYAAEARLSWAQSVTERLPTPRTPVEARHSIQDAEGNPFPLALPVPLRWDSLGRGENEWSNARKGDLAKLLWMEGYPRETFPVGTFE